MTTYIIYEIVCKDSNIKSSYVGHSKNFNKRQFSHKNPYNNNPKSKLFNYPLYKAVRENMGWENWIIRPIEILNESNKNEAIIREQYWIEERKSDLNQIKAMDKNECRRIKNNKKYLKNKETKLKELIEKICNQYISVQPSKNINIDNVIQHVKQDLNY